MHGACGATRWLFRLRWGSCGVGPSRRAACVKRSALPLGRGACFAVQRWRRANRDWRWRVRSHPWASSRWRARPLQKRRSPLRPEAAGSACALAEKEKGSRLVSGTPVHSGAEGETRTAHACILPNNLEKPNAGGPQLAQGLKHETAQAVKQVKCIWAGEKAI